MQQQEGLTYSIIPLFILQHKRFVVAAPFKAWLLKLLPYRQRNAYASAFFFPFKHMLEVGARKKRHMNATFIHGNKNDKSIFFSLRRMTNDCSKSTVVLIFPERSHFIHKSEVVSLQNSSQSSKSIL